MEWNGITKENHVFADYSYIPLVYAAPKIAGFSENKKAATICRVFSLAALGYSLLTDAKWGAVKLIPYRVHAGLDLASGVASLAVLAVPEVYKDKAARNTFILMGLTGLIVGTLSLIGAKSSDSHTSNTQ